jgi:hypothetical protein
MEVCKRKMGKKGPFKCFTVDRDDRTIITRFGNNLSGYCVTDFYDIPSEIDYQQTKPSNKQKFLKAQRFIEAHRDGPTPTAYFPQNFTLKPKFQSPQKMPIKNPIFFYQHTTVPQKPMSFHKPSSSPAPGRYNPHDVTCSCCLTKNNKKCLSNGHSHVFDSRMLRLVKPITITTTTTTDNSRARKLKSFFMENDNNVTLGSNRQTLVPEMTLLARKRSVSAEELSRSKSEREIRYNTIMKKKKSFGSKTNVAFLSATPRFADVKNNASVKTIDKPPKGTTTNNRQVASKHLTQKRMNELATPRNPAPKVGTQKVQIFKPIPKPPKSGPCEISVAPSKTNHVTFDSTDELSMEHHQSFKVVGD